MSAPTLPIDILRIRLKNEIQACQTELRHHISVSDRSLSAFPILVNITLMRVPGPYLEGDRVIHRFVHKVAILITEQYPIEKPIVKWRTPIFHPNIHPQAGKVCLGALEDHYRPSLDFGELCQLLVDIASYQNYAVNEAYDAAALEWAHSPQGQAAIERRGGQSLTRKILHHLRQPRPLRIRRVDDEL